MIRQLFFYLFALICILSAAFAVSSRKPSSGVLYLVTTMFGISGLFALQGAFFLAATQILIYAGAILVLFLFVLMLIGTGQEVRTKLGSLDALSVICASLVLTSLFAFAIHAAPDMRVYFANLLFQGTVQTVGMTLFSKYMLPFELISLILLAGVMGVIHLSKKES